MKKQRYKFIDKAVYLEEEKILVIADLHLGYEEAMARQGILLPRFQFKEVKENLERIFKELGKEKKKVKDMVILGDLKHDFGSVSFQEFDDIGKLLKFLEEKIRNGKIILIRGNHDTFFSGKIKKRIKIKEKYRKKDILFIHGDKKLPLQKIAKDEKIKLVFLGHLHPAVSIREGAKEEKYKCFLAGKFKNKEIVILPSFFPLTEGADILNMGGNLGFDFNLKKFGVFVPVSDSSEVLNMGRVEKIGRLV